MDSIRIIRDHEVYIVPWAGIGIRISSRGKVEAGVDSTRITRGHEAHIAKPVRARIRISSHDKAEVGVDSTRIFRVEDRADTTKVSKVEVKNHAARALDVRT